MHDVAILNDITHSASSTLSAPMDKEVRHNRVIVMFDRKMTEFHDSFPISRPGVARAAIRHVICDEERGFISVDPNAIGAAT